MSTTLTGLSPGKRFVCAGAALLVNGLIAGTVFGVFDQASPREWLRPTPALLADIARCRDIAGRDEHNRCLQTVITAHRSRQGEAVWLAQQP